MKRILGIYLDKLWTILPENLDTRADICLAVTFPVILIKALRKTFFPAKTGTAPSTPTATETFKAEACPPGTEGEDIAVRYSGGDDSTLVAALSAQNFRKVHLLTFTSDSRLNLFGFINSDPENTKVNERNLSEKYGEGRFHHRIINFGQLRNEIYFRDFLPACREDNFLKSCFCIPCTLAMHIETIIYCLRNGIRFASDGSNNESGLLYWQTQNPFNLREVSEFYKRFGITYIVNPAYHCTDTGELLNRLGVHDVAGSKKNYQHRRRTQQFCHLIQIQTVCRRLCGTPGDRAATSGEKAGHLSRFFGDSLDGYERHIRTKLAEVPASEYGNN